MTAGRRRLLDGLGNRETAPAPPSVELVKEAAEKNGFGFAAEPVTAPSALEQGSSDALVRRVRKSVGRTHPLNVRLKPATVAEIMSIANSRDVPIAQVIEELLDAAREIVRKG